MAAIQRFTSANRVPEPTASVTALLALTGWWAGIARLDGVLAGTFPYERYESIAHLYPEVYYPGVPGMVLAEALYVIGIDVILER